MNNPRNRILVVEDEILVAFEMTDTLEEMGFEVVGPSVHLDDARTSAATEQIDAAFLDVNLGNNQTSESVAIILRQRSVPFVFITAYDRTQISFLQPGDRVVRKPISSDKLLEALRGVLPGA